MCGKHRAPRPPWSGDQRCRATAIVLRETGVHVREHLTMRHNDAEFAEWDDDADQLGPVPEYGAYAELVGDRDHDGDGVGLLTHPPYGGERW